MADGEGEHDAHDGDGTFIVEALLSEGWRKEEDGSRVWKYLVKWEDYNMHEYVSSVCRRVGLTSRVDVRRLCIAVPHSKMNEAWIGPQTVYIVG